MIDYDRDIAESAERLARLDRGFEREQLRYERFASVALALATFFAIVAIGIAGWGIGSGIERFLEQRAGEDTAELGARGR